MTAFGKFLGITAKTPEFVRQAVANFAEKGLGLLRPHLRLSPNFDEGPLMTKAAVTGR